MSAERIAEWMPELSDTLQAVSDNLDLIQMALQDLPNVRDFFAAAAIGGVALRISTEAWPLGELADDAYKIADACIAARKLRMLGRPPTEEEIRRVRAFGKDPEESSNG